MPLYAIFSDVHSNLTALRAILADAEEQGATSCFCLGDIVGYGPQPQECVDLVRSLACPVVKGNHEELVAHDFYPLDMNPLARAGIIYSRKHLLKESREWLQQLPRTVRAPKATMVHASLHDPDEWRYVFDAEDAQLTMERQRTSVCFLGHTHVPALYSQVDAAQPLEVEDLRFYLPPKGRYLVNVGSVGQPRNRDPRAQYVLFDPRRREVLYRRVPYDVQATARLIYDTGLPRALGERLLVGR